MIRRYHTVAHRSPHRNDRSIHSLGRTVRQPSVGLWSDAWADVPDFVAGLTGIRQSFHPLPQAGFDFCPKDARVLFGRRQAYVFSLIQVDQDRTQVGNDFAFGPGIRWTLEQLELR
jgi:hypothetical protein